MYGVQLVHCCEGQPSGSVLPGRERRDRHRRHKQQVVGLVQSTHPHPEVNPHPCGVEEVRCGGIRVALDASTQPRVNPVDRIIAVCRNHLRGAGEPQHLERLHWVCEAGVDLVDEGASGASTSTAARTALSTSGSLRT